jgi:hypothetical protein
MPFQVTEFEPTNSYVQGHRREKHFTEQHSAITKDGREIVILRVYKAPTGATWACLWINWHSRARSVISSGSATKGSGYNHQASAVAQAFTDAGFKFNFNPDGFGHSEKIVEVAARYLAPDDFLTVISAHA